MTRYVMALDQGTTGTTVLLVDSHGTVRGKGYSEFPQAFPRAGWVEHDPEEIWHSTLKALQDALTAAGCTGKEIAAIGITNQRETVVAWDRGSLAPVRPAIVWQCRRTADMCRSLKEAGYEPMFRKKTGLILDPYFSGTKYAWMLRNDREVERKALDGSLALGTVDSYLIARLTGGKRHVTDVSNASRTLLMDLHTLMWDSELCDTLGVPRGALPDIVDNCGEIGRTLGVPGLPDGIPIAGVAGDQQAALFGQLCLAQGEGKCTLGTGAFILVNIGAKPLESCHGLLTTVAWRLSGQTSYAFEGSAFVAGAAIQWLRDGLKLIRSAREVEALAASVPDSGGVVFVPALTGLGAPHWRPEARGAVLGITRGTTSAHLARAVLEGIALQNMDIMKAMERDLGRKLTAVKVDGGAAANDLLMQLQADLIETPVLRPKQLETTGLGAAFLAGLGTNFWSDIEQLGSVWQLDREFTPRETPTLASLIEQWHAAVEKA